MSDEKAENLDDKKEPENPEKDPTDVIEPEGDEEDEKPPESDEEEEVVVIQEGSQPRTKQTQRHSKRINRLNANIAEQKGRADGYEAENQSLKEQNKLFELALEQERNKTQAPQRPKETDFDEGRSDPKFIQQEEAFNDYRINKRVNEEVNKLSNTTNQQAIKDIETREFRIKEDAHIERARSFKAKNFNEVQEKAIEHLGTEVVEAIIREYDDSELVIYYLGTNTDEADHLRATIEKSQFLGVSEIGAIRKQLKVQPKSTIVPDPDEQLEGTTTANSAIQRTYEKKLEKLVNKIDNKQLGGIRAIINLKKEAKEKGVLLE